VEIDEKDQKIRDLKDLLYKAHLKITYLHQENMELRHNVSQETIQPSEGEPSSKTL